MARRPLKLPPVYDGTVKTDVYIVGPRQPMNLADETEAYQALLEGHRAHPDDEDLYEDLLKARAQLEIAWLQEATRASR